MGDINKENDVLVSILIPAYNKPNFLKIALNSALQQTYKNIEIIICDDSTNNQVQTMVEPYLSKYSNIKYFNNGEPLGAYGIENSKKCLSLANGEYINYLFDDDKFYCAKIQKMVKYLKDDSVSLVTSRRSRINSKGNVLPDIAATKPISNVDRIYDGKEIGRRMLLTQLNFIGEPTTALFRKKDIEGFGMFMGRQYECLVDMAMWLDLLLKGKFVYIPEILSSFRIHRQQKTSNRQIGILGKKEIRYLLEDGCKAGFIGENELKR
ncbi:glycosyltransferase family 2 protein [Clostridium magnum]|uniref:Hyaluronan synthase n=1 Tax=Clostridium magnum DSM 2767 TaxID=1121326 RepID=A0A162UA99_9CLOT|nr:glycosyltransferase family 2 protein [Clostridium magnum]KZL93695.1 hyaluronan synthase [Clostridium magnum DSM 2767]SHI10150.1 Glycosyl transferase family 2 [Clostridium magnum DSM 2767]